MATLERFEGWEAWHGTIAFVREDRAMVDDGPLVRGFGLREPVRRPAVSIRTTLPGDLGIPEQHWAAELNSVAQTDF